MNYLATGFACMGILLVSLASARADFTLTPGLVLRQEYDDNIYLDSDHKVDDFITKITPSLLMRWETPRIDLTADVRIHFEKYYDNTDEDRIGPGEADQASTVNALVNVYKERVFLRITDSYQRVPIDEGGRGGEDSNVVNLTDSNRLAINPYLQFEPMSDLTVRLGYTYENLWYGNSDNDNRDEDDSSGDDSESHIYNLALTKVLSPRVTLSANASHLEYRPKDPSETFAIDEEGTYEYDQNDAHIGLTYQLSERLQLQGGYGHSWLDYDVREDTDSSVWNVSADYEFSSTLKTGVAYDERYQVTVEDGPSKRKEYSAYLQYDDRYRVRASVFSSNNKYVEIGREDDVYGGLLGGTLPFTDTYGLDWRLRYANYDQSGIEDEQYDRYGARLVLYYDIKLGRISLGYVYTKNDSDLDGNDYTSNIAYLEASLKF